jgi:hypothetical protein
MARAYLVFGDIEGRLEMLRVECTRCQRKGRYSVLKLIQQYGPCADIATNPRNSFNFFVTATPQGRARLARSSIIHGTAADRGRVVGIDITPAMVAKAETATKYLGLTNVHVHVGDIAALSMENAFILPLSLQVAPNTKAKRMTDADVVCGIKIPGKKLDGIILKTSCEYPTLWQLGDSFK